jgi:hypothetical protein
MYHLELFRASEDTLSRWSLLHLQSLTSTPFPRRVDVVKIITESLSQHDEKHGVPTLQWDKDRRMMMMHNIHLKTPRSADIHTIMREDRTSDLLHNRRGENSSTAANQSSE